MRRRSSVARRGVSRDRLLNPEANVNDRGWTPADRARRALGRRRRATAVALLVTALAACSSPQARETTPTAKVERARIERIVVATGTIEPENEVEVRSRISGIVDKIDVEAGDQVT